MASVRSGGLPLIAKPGWVGRKIRLRLFPGQCPITLPGKPYRFSRVSCGLAASVFRGTGSQGRRASNYSFKGNKTASGFVPLIQALEPFKSLVGSWRDYCSASASSCRWHFSYPPIASLSRSHFPYRSHGSSGLGQGLGVGPVSTSGQSEHFCFSAARAMLCPCTPAGSNYSFQRTAGCGRFASHRSRPAAA